MNEVEHFVPGDKKGFENIFNLYFHRLCAFSFNYIKDANESEDLVQEAFLSLWKNRKGFDHPTAIKTYLYNTVKNKCLNYLKHQLVVQKNETSLIQELQNESDFQNQVIKEEVFGQLYAAVNSLPDGAQKIMVLVLKGMKNREIAEKLQISENTVKTQKKIAYSKLKANIEPVAFSILISL